MPRHMNLVAKDKGLNLPAALRPPGLSCTLGYVTAAGTG